MTTAPAGDGSIAVNFPGMEQAAEDVRTCHNTLIQQQEDLRTFLNGLRGDWHGVGGESWDHAQNRWHTAADNMYLILGQLYQALSDAHTNYTGNESALENFWNG
jgi:WXG100 family type VII secretion target